MTKLEELQLWEKKGSNFSRGVELCKKYNIRPDLVNGVFGQGPTKGNKRLLLQVLMKEKSALMPNALEKQPKDAHEVRAMLAERFSMRQRYPDIKLAVAPDFIKLMFSEALGTWDKAVYMHDENLVNAETDEERFTIMDALISEIEMNDAAHKELRHFNDTGEVLGEHPKYAEFYENEDAGEDTMSELEKEFRSIDTADLMKKRNNLRTQISKARKALDAEPENADMKAKLEGLEAAEKLANDILSEEK